MILKAYFYLFFNFYPKFVFIGFTPNARYCFIVIHYNIDYLLTIVYDFGAFINNF